MNVALAMMRDINNKPLFSVKFLGEKAKLLDFVVNLLDDNESEIGPFFMIQVKSTKRAKVAESIPAKFTAKEVLQAQNRKIPIYLASVAEINGRTREIFFLAVDSTRSKGVSVVPRLHNLDCDVTLKALYDEVKQYHDNQSHSFVSAFGGDNE
ncbi:hypothetical protein A9K81_20385 [Pseudomonas syringae pv. syringae]|nr:hypothetical protein A9K81_20385 [Pseudomonas syringae pv. syringae]